MDNGEGDGQLEPDPSQVKGSNEDNDNDQICNDLEIKPFQQNYWLPNEMWDKIFGELDAPKDILLCCDVCYFWNSLLQRKKTTAYFELILPDLFPYLGPQDLFVCTGVSKDWSSWIDTIALNYRKNIWSMDDRLIFLQIEELQAATGHMFQFDDNKFYRPFKYRWVFIKDEEDMDDAEFEVFCQNLLRFLQGFGNFIYQLDVHTNMKLIQMIRVISICLSNTPNLEVLVWSSDTENYEATDEDVHLMEEFITASPLPNSGIRKLEVDEAPVKLVDVLLQRYGNQLVYVHDFYNVDFHKMMTRGVTFQNIKVFRSTLFGSTYLDRADRMGGVYYVSMILQLLKWTLSEVDLMFVGGFDSSWLSFNNLFKALELHQPHIHTLRLSLDPVRTPGHLYSFPAINLESMYLPSLKRLTLDQIGIPPIRVFQKATPKLEYLTIYSRDNYEWILPDDKLEEMWKALPNCKMIRSSNFIKDINAENPVEPHTHTFIRN